MTWKNKPTNFTRTVATDAEKKTKRTALKLLRELVIVSPVDTGRFVANWIIGLGRPNRRTTSATDKGRSATTARAGSAVRRFKARQKSIWISNNLPYAERLNEGWSDQAPANFVQKAINKVSDK